MTLREALATAFSQLHASPTLREHALRDATLLLLHALGISRASLLANYDRIVTPEEQAAYQQMVDRRLTNEPIQYITGEREFYGLPLRVNPAVLIPRNLTEHLVEATLEEMRPRDQAGKSLRIVDVGTGSGAIAIALAYHLPNARITALDLSAEALEVAVSNAELNAVSERIRFLESDLLSAVSSEPAFDAVVSNPPYIGTSERDELHPQIRDYEPEVSLYGGDTGLDIYRRLIPQAHASLKPNGLLALEMGTGHTDAIAIMLADWDQLRYVENLQHIPCIAIAHRS